MSKRGKSGPFSKLVGAHASAIPSVLQVSEFFLARAPEVIKLYHSLKVRDGYAPSHLRRRTKAFRPYHQRPKLRRSKHFFPRAMSRRTRRLHRTYLLESVGEKHRLPATHVWHAKRFRMENMWGMRLPVHVSDKGERAILRLSQHRCCIHDRSYLDCWRVSGDSTDGVVDILRSIGIPSSVGHVKVVSGEFFASGFITSDDKCVVSPFQALWRAEGVVDIWTHPAARPEVQPLMDSASAEFRNRQVRFELAGSRVAEYLAKTTGVRLEDFECVPGKVAQVKDHGWIMNIRAGGGIVDVVFDDAEGQPMWLWRSLVAAGASAIGVADRHALLSQFHAPDFPYDFPATKAGARYAAGEARRVLEADQAKPRQCKMNVGSVESPYFSDWTLVGCASRVPVAGELRPIVLHAVRGIAKPNAHIYANGILAGFVTTTCGRTSLRAVGHVAAHVGDSALIQFQNPGSVHKFDAKITACKLSSTDSTLLGFANA